MRLLTIDDIKRNKTFIQGIRWDVTPKIFISPASAPRSELEKSVDITYGYMLYVDIVKNKPTLMIMMLKRMMSQNVGCVVDVPEELLQDAMNCKGPDCIAGMYPITGKLEDWLKKELGVS
ncbi:MAG: DVU0772 family protein [Nitrospirota bacterium]